MFLAINTAGLAIIPMTSLNYLSAGGVKNAHEIIAPAFIATLISTIAGVVAAKLLQGLPAYRVLPDTAPADAPATPDTPSSAPVAPARMTGLRMVLIAVATVAFLLGAAFQFMPETRSAFLQKTGMQSLLDDAAAKSKVAEARKAEIKKNESAPSGTTTATTAVAPPEPLPLWRQGLLGVSILAIPCILLVVVLWGLARGVPVYEEMVEGAKEGFGVATRIMPFLVIMLVGLSVFRESGALMLLEYMLRPVLSLIGMPVELFPLAVMRPLSGSGSAGLLNEVILNPASTDFLRYTAAILYGSTETTFYVIAVYFGCVSIRRTRHAIAAGLIADVAGLGAGLALGWLMFAGR
jgi:spore maturation protein SpmB